MAATTPLTFAQLDSLTRNLLNDNINFVATSPESLNAQTWDEPMMAEALNFAVKEYCRLTDVTYVEVALPIGTDSKATLPDDRLEIQRVKYPAIILLPPVWDADIGTVPSGVPATYGPVTISSQDGGVDISGATFDWSISEGSVQTGEYAMLDGNGEATNSVTYLIATEPPDYYFIISCVVTVDGVQYTLSQEVGPFPI